MSADDSRIKQQVFQVAILRAMLEQRFKDLEFTPAGEAFIDRVPAAILARQQPPLCAATSNPEDGFEEAAAIAASPEPYLGAGSQDGQKLLPLFVGQLNCHHGDSLAASRQHNLVKRAVLQWRVFYLDEDRAVLAALQAWAEKTTAYASYRREDLLVTNSVR